MGRSFDTENRRLTRHATVGNTEWGDRPSGPRVRSARPDDQEAAPAAFWSLHEPNYLRAQDHPPPLFSGAQVDWILRLPENPG
jgi:hypothetical protein